MGRAGGGGGGGHSGGGHAGGSRSSGGHHVGGGGFGGGRAGGGSYGGGMNRGGGPRGPMGGPRGVHHHHYHGGFYGPRRSGGCFSSIFIVIVFVIMFGIMIFGETAQEPTTTVVESTITREALDTSNTSFINDCIQDDLGWFDNESKTETQLQYFYETTGVQPMIYLKSYDDSLTTDDEKLEWAENYYDETYDQENIFLYIYFAEENSDEDVGYMCYVNGYQVSSVMDSEAVEIFWNYIDRYWYSDASTDDVFINTFTNTADSIMHIDNVDSGSGSSVWITVLTVIAVVAIVVGVVFLVKKARE